VSLIDFLKGGSDMDRFAKRIMARIRRRGWRGNITYDAKEFRLVLAEGEGSQVMNLSKAYRAWRKVSGSQKDQQLDITIGFLFEVDVGQTFESAKPHLLPAIRNRSHLHAALFFTTEPDKAALPAYRPFCETMGLALVLDTETAIRFVYDETLERWGVSFETALETALGNLRAQSPFRFHRQSEGFWFSDFGDHHDAARLLLPDLFDAFNFTGPPVVVPLDRAGIMVADAENTDALKAMATFAEENLPTADRPIAYTPIILEGGAWQPVDTSQTSFSALAMLPARQTTWDYEEQKAALERQLAAQNRDIFVASVLCLRREETLHTLSTLGEGIDTLLPRTDTVAVGHPQQDDTVYRLWADVEAAFGPFEAEPGLYPPRYRVDAWKPGAWEAIQAAPTSPLSPVGDSG
jgi:hypothetical protein